MNIVTTFQGLDVSSKLTEYFEEKLFKHEQLFISATSITVRFHKNAKRKGVNKDYKIDINVLFPKALIRVEEDGENLNALVDTSVDVLLRRVKRYHDRQTNWEGITPWSDLEALNELEEVEPIDDYINYVPKISVRRNMRFTSPMSEAEAIERMELLGDTQILFKNLNTKNICMIYKNISGQYILVEPKEEL
jgi:ribosomal subunit interface protein